MIQAINLKTEYLVNPIGIDIKKPRLMWNCKGCIKQTAYQIVASINNQIVYDSGKVISSSMHVDYPMQVSSREIINWSVTLWDENDEKGESSHAFFEMGLINKGDWKAKWISGSYHVNKRIRYPVDYFKKEFVLTSIKKARLYITACGLYEIRLNGKRVGNFVLAPGSTDYNKRIQYQSYDVTSLIKNGNNEMLVELADGWYRGSNGAKGRTNTYGKQTKFCAQLELVSNDGITKTICTDETWSWSNDGAIMFADLKDGEIINANKIASYKYKAKVINFNANLTASNNVPVIEHEKFLPIEYIISPSGKKILKFPQNLSGYISFSLNAHEGDIIHIVLGEMLDNNGEFTLENVQCIHKGKRTPLQEFTYICKEGLNIYKPKFFYGGFQYALIETNIPFKKEDFVAIAVYSDFEKTGSFECSHPLINKLYQNTMWSLKSNSTDLPSDCPTRERMGWTGDSQIFFNTASYMVNYASFARKHVNDIFDRQWKSGRLPQIAPFANEDWFMWVMNGSIGWACAGVYIPLYFYHKYGDERLLEEYYEQILKYAFFMIKRAGKWGGIYSKPMHLSHKNRKYAVNCGQSYGEWAEPNDVCAFKWYDFASPHPEESTAYTYFTLKRVLEVADILKKKFDKRLAKIKEYSEGAAKAYQELVTKKSFSLDTDRQAKLVRPLYMGILNSKQEEFAKNRLLKAMDNYDWRLGTGFLSTPFILDVLAKLDIEYAYKLLENEKCPGWLFMVKNNATTIWESWEGNLTSDKGIASLNHYSKGAVCEWLMNTMCGININGENTFIISPLPGGSITFAKASYNSIYGQVECSWERKDKSISYVIKIPSNTMATIILPSGKKENVLTGTYIFSE